MMSVRRRPYVDAPVAAIVGRTSTYAGAARTMAKERTR